MGFLGKTPKIFPVASTKRKESGSCPGWRRATSRARILAAATASAALGKVEVSRSIRTPLLSQSIANKARPWAKNCGRNQLRSFRIRTRQFPRCSVSIIIGGELLEIRAECHCYHGNTTSKREQERQRCNEGLHGRSPVQNGDRSALERIASVEKHLGIDTKNAA
jgi:hypothetical protein